jgi:hypothetical protein
MSLHQIFATNTFVASNAPLKDWHSISGDGVAGQDKLGNLQGFDVQMVSSCSPVGLHTTEKKYSRAMAY